MTQTVLVTGGTGFLGTRLLHAFITQEAITINAASHDTADLHVFDLFMPENRLNGVYYHEGSLTDSSRVSSLIAEIQPTVIVHLAAVVSSAAERDFDLGMNVNVDGTRTLLEACRTLSHTPRLIFSSSVAVFGAVSGDVTDATPALPLSTYGASKVLGEVLVNEYSRRRFIDGITLRLPTIAVRPGRPNKAASSFVSGIIREPLSGQRAVCPVDPSLSLWIMSPRQIIQNLIHAIALDSRRLENNRIINLPGLTVTVQQMVEALDKAGGKTSLIDWKPDPAIAGIVATWPGHMETPKANGLGFSCDESIDAVVRAYIEEELAKN